jgi:hypothetical protein
MDAMIEMRRAALRGDPEREAKAWLDKLAEVKRHARRPSRSLRPYEAAGRRSRS